MNAFIRTFDRCFSIFLRRLSKPLSGETDVLRQEQNGERFIELEYLLHEQSDLDSPVWCHNTGAIDREGSQRY
jgi:hypothetical protein